MESASESIIKERGMGMPCPDPCQRAAEGKVPLLRKIREFLVIQKGCKEPGHSSQFGVGWNGFAGMLGSHIHPPKEGEIPPKATGILMGDAPFPGKSLLFLGKKLLFQKKSLFPGKPLFFPCKSLLIQSKFLPFPGKTQSRFSWKKFSFSRRKKTHQTFPSKMLLFPGKTP